MAIRLSGLMVCLLWVPLASAQDDGFSHCIANLQDRARAAHLPKAIIDNVLAKLELQPKVIELDRAQPEFTQTFADYFYRRITTARIDQGRRLREEYRQFLAEVTARYGIPGQYLMAFWGLETNFGAILGNLPTLDSLATLACDDRRSDYFTSELMTALILLNRESLTPGEMRGSWAGAMGQTQFMPSTYREYAVDGDHDGHINLWKSPQDALASGANYLAKLGWRPGERWGQEVLLPEKFPYAQSGLDNRHTLRFWTDLGVIQADKSPLPNTNIQASLLLPSGHTGPAFLVYHNFDVIMGWNHNDFYALSVGLLADRIDGAGVLARPPPAGEPALRRDMIMRIQQRLNELGYHVGTPDGVIGSATQSALRAFQGASGRIADGYPDDATLRALKVNTQPAS